jgi:hypothetical protein
LTLSGDTQISIGRAGLTFGATPIRRAGGRYLSGKISYDGYDRRASEFNYVYPIRLTPLAQFAVTAEAAAIPGTALTFEPGLVDIETSVSSISLNMIASSLRVPALKFTGEVTLRSDAVLSLVGRSESSFALTVASVILEGSVTANCVETCADRIVSATNLTLRGAATGMDTTLYLPDNVMFDLPLGASVVADPKVITSNHSDFRIRRGSKGPHLVFDSADAPGQSRFHEGSVIEPVSEALESGDEMLARQLRCFSPMVCRLVCSRCATRAAHFSRAGSG